MRSIAAISLTVAVALSGCGGGGSSSSGGGGMDDITWPSRDGTPTTMLPPAVKIGRVVFSSQSGEACCVAVDPSILSGSAQRGLAILNDLPVGPATVTVAGFTTTFAPTVAGITTTCSTVPADAAQPCDQVQVASPAYESPPLAVTIIAGVQTNIGDVPMEAFPFLFDFSPAQEAAAPAPVQFDLTVVDAATNIRQDSVQLEVSFNVPDENAQPSGSPFRLLTKRVELDLKPCADGTSVPCSPNNLQLAGFNATGTAPELPEGAVEARIVAQNTADPPRNLDFRYSFVVLATPTATATAEPTAAAPAPAAQAETGAAPGAAAPAAGAAAGAPQTGSAAAADAGAAGRTGRGAAPSDSLRHHVPPTPTATPAPGAA